MTITPIDTYAVRYSSNTLYPRIWLRHNQSYIGQLVFWPNGSTLPADTQSGNQVLLFYHLDDFQNAIDLLRNESPMFLLYMGPSGENGIVTSQEIIGEGE